MSWCVETSNASKSHFWYNIHFLDIGWRASICGASARHIDYLAPEPDDAEKRNRCKNCESIQNKEVQS